MPIGRSHGFGELTKGICPQHHSLLFAIDCQAMVQKLRALLAPVASPVCTWSIGSVAIKSHKNVYCVCCIQIALLRISLELSIMLILSILSPKRPQNKNRGKIPLLILVLTLAPGTG